MKQQNWLQLPALHQEADVSYLSWRHESCGCSNTMRRAKWQCFSSLRATGIAPFPILIAADSVFPTDVRYFLYLHRSKEEPGVDEDGEGLAAYQTVTAWYGRKRMFTVRDHNVDSLSPKFPPPPFPMSVWSTGLLEDRHGCCVHYHCGRPWNYRRGAAFPSEKGEGCLKPDPGFAGTL